MILQSRISARERILTFGVAGTGKSYGLLKIADRTEGQFYIIDNDNAYERLLSDPEFENLDHDRLVINGQPVGEMGIADTWDDTIELIDKAYSVMGPDDWLVIDSLTPTWDQVQDYYTDKVWAQGIDEYFLAVRAEKARKSRNERSKKDSGDDDDDSANLGAFEGWKDWPVINKLYSQLHRRILNCPGHLYATAEVTDLGKKDDKSIRDMAGGMGVKPKGQKRIPHLFQTILLMEKQRSGVWKMTTYKDRAREEMVGEEVVDFSKEYLMRVARWRPVSGG